MFGDLIILAAKCVVVSIFVIIGFGICADIFLGKLIEIASEFAKYYVANREKLESQKKQDQ